MYLIGICLCYYFWTNLAREQLLRRMGFGHSSDVRGAGAGRMEAMGGATHVEAEACN
jgi:hypothetical protein